MRVRERRILAGFGIMTVGVLAIVLVMDVTAILSWRLMPFPIAIALIAALSPGLYIVARPYWTRLDDRQRQVKTTNWYWGSLCGLVFAVASSLVIGGFTPGHFSAFTKGVLYVLAVQVVGYYLVRLIAWQADRQGGA